MSAVLDMLRIERAKLVAELATLDNAIGVIEGRLAVAEQPKLLPPVLPVPMRAPPSPPDFYHPRPRGNTLRSKVLAAMLGYDREAWLTHEEIAALVPEEPAKRVRAAVYDLNDFDYPLLKRVIRGEPTRYRIHPDWTVPTDD